MLEIFLLGAGTCTILLVLILWMESAINKNDEFITVKEWHNFQTAMKEEK